MKTKEELFEENKGLVYSVINTKFAFIKQTEYYQDVMQVGFMGLWKALNDYDSGKGTTIGTYAYNRIYGEIRVYVFRNEKQVKRYKNYNNVFTFTSLNAPTEHGTEIMEFIEDDTDNYATNKLEIYNFMQLVGKEKKHKDAKIDTSTILELLAKGMSQSDIARKYGVTQGLISNKLTKLKRRLIAEGIVRTDLRGGLYIAN